MTVSDRFDNGEWVKAIYFGLPMEIRKDPECPEDGAEGRGLFSNLVFYLPFNGKFAIYEGSYFVALWYWLTVNDDDFDDDLGW